MSFHKKLLTLLNRNRRLERQSAGRSRIRRLTHERMEERCLMAVIDLATLTAQQGTKFFSSTDLGYYREVSSAGDVNGDGFEDLMLSARGNIGDNYGEGRVFIVYGRATMPATVDLANLGTAGISIQGNNLYHGIGISLSGAGDVNGDGFDDFIIGAAYRQKGKSYLIFGGSSLPSTLDLATLGSRGVEFISTGTFDASGWAVSGAGDVNGDGFDDLVVGSPSSASGISVGAYVIYGRDEFVNTVFPNTFPLSQSDLKIFNEVTRDATGLSVSGAGDVNGDGYDDLIVGAPLADTSDGLRPDAGGSYLIFGAPSTSSPKTIFLSSLGTAGVKIIGADAGDQMGRSVSNAGDINGDGFDDIIVGSPYADATNNSKSNAGESYVVFGRAVFPSTIDLRSLGTGGMILSGTDADDFSGYQVSGAGDVNSDGFDDVLIAARGADGLGNNRPSAGESYVVFGKATLPSTLNLAQLNDAGIKIIGAPVIPGVIPIELAVSDAGDVNGDGFADVLVDYRLIFGGNNFTSSVNRLGTAASETLTGTASADNIVGGRGNDVLVGSGGADVLLGGQGNDVLAISSLDFRRVRGGTGSDTLRFDGSGMGLKLGDRRLDVFETVDITGTGDNLLVVKLPDITRIPNKTLVVRGNAGDKVNYGTGWSQVTAQLINGVSYYVFKQGTLTLKVQFGVTVNQAPAIAAFGGQVTASENGPAILLDTDAVVKDVDSLNFAGGNLTVSIIANPEFQDRIEIKNTGNAAGQIGISDSTVKYGNKIIGTFAGTTTLIVTLNGNATPQAVQALLRNITFKTTSVSTLTRTVQVSVNDGDGATSNLPTKTVRAIASNVAPVLANFGSNFDFDVSFTSSVLVAPTATVTDPDSNFYKGTLTLSNLNAQPEDFFTVSANSVIESVTGGQGLTPLVVTINASELSTSAGVQAVLRSISWGTNSRVEGPRTLTVTLTDGDGGTSNSLAKVVNVVRTRVTPTISFVSAGIDYYIPDTYRQLIPNVVLTAGRLSDFTNAQLTFYTTQGGNAGDLLLLTPNNQPLTWSGGVVIGTVAGGTGLTPLVVTFNANATPEAVQGWMRALTWKTQATVPAKSSRTISVSLTVEGLQSPPQDIPIRISFAPEVTFLAPTVTYNIAGPAVRVASNVSISGLASRNFVNGNLVFALTKNGEATDLFAIRNEGVGNSQIGISGSNVTYEGTVIGTFSGGSGLTPLVVTFNANATRESVQKLMRVVTWKSTIAGPSLNARTFSITLTDGDGLQGSPATAQVLLI